LSARKYILSTTNLEIGYTSAVKNGKSVYQNINVKARQGELIAVIGPNGIGKSTLLRSIAGLQNTVNGNILLNSKSINNYSRHELAKLISFVSTDIIRVNNMKVFDLVALGRFPHTNWLGNLKDDDRKLIGEAIDGVGLVDLANKNINEISDGERQRAMIARTLAQDTEMVVLDEPTAFLDIPNKYEIIHLLNNLSKNRKKTIIFATHDLNIAIYETDLIWLMLPAGISEGSPEDLILNGALDKIFGSEELYFDTGKGDFVRRKEMFRKIRLSGSGNEYIWTKKALERLGFVVVSNQNVASSIKILKKKSGKIWMYQKKGNKIEFKSIYELSLYLQTSDI
jgi:iron complex transport system ATP-binding protein